MAFPLQRVPGLALREVFRSLEPWDTIHLTQTSHKTRCLISMIARIPIIVYIDCGPIRCVHFRFLGYNNWMQFRVIGPAPVHNQQARWWKFGKRWTEWAVGWRYDPYRAITTWADRFDGLRALIDFFADTFNVRSVSFRNVRDIARGPYQLLSHIVVNRKRPLVRIHWDSDMTTQDQIPGILEMSIGLRYLRFEVPQGMPVNFDRFNELLMEHVQIDRGNWITRKVLCGLSNCLKVEVDQSQITDRAFNALLKHLGSCPGRVEGWEIFTSFQLKKAVVLKGIDYEELKSTLPDVVKFAIKQCNGEKLEVMYTQFVHPDARNPKYLFALRAMS